MLLSDKRILEELNSGNIVIEPFDGRQLGTNSYDCRLGEWYFQGDHGMPAFCVDDPDAIRAYWGYPQKATWVAERQMYCIPIHPGTTVLAHTQEVIGGRNGFLGKMYSRSTVARSGL